MQFKKITASADNILSGKYRIHRVILVSGSDAASAILFDGTQVGAVDFAGIKANAAYSEGHEIDYTTRTSVSVTLSGTNAILYIYYS